MFTLVWPLDASADVLHVSLKTGKLTINKLPAIVRIYLASGYWDVFEQSCSAQVYFHCEKRENVCKVYIHANLASNYVDA